MFYQLFDFCMERVTKVMATLPFGDMIITSLLITGIYQGFHF